MKNNLEYSKIDNMAQYNKQRESTESIAFPLDSLGGRTFDEGGGSGAFALAWRWLLDRLDDHGAHLEGTCDVEEARELFFVFVVTVWRTNRRETVRGTGRLIARRREDVWM